MQLNLKNPLVFFDLETTGINIVKDRIVEISFVKVYPNGKEESKTRRINPEMPIPPESTAIHGITDEEVINFGKYKGRLVEEVLKNDPGYYSWIMNGDFPLNTKKILTEIKLRGFNSK